jgi:hypothetical protein
MTENLLRALPEVFVSTADITVMVSRATKAGTLRKLATRLYTKNLTEAPEIIIKRNLWHIVSGYFPGALVADRTALENTPASDGSICLITDKGKDIALPSISLHPRRGAPALPTSPFSTAFNFQVICNARVISAYAAARGTAAIKKEDHYVPPPCIATISYYT